MNELELRPLSAGEVLDQAFRLYRGNFSRLVLVGIVCYAPMALLYAMSGTSFQVVEPGPSWSVLTVVLGLVSILFGMASWGALTSVTVAAVEGSDVPLGRALLNGIALLPRLILLGILSYLLMAGCFIPAALVGGVGAAIGAFSGAGGGSVVSTIVLGVVVTGVVVVTFIWWIALTVLSLPAMVGERIGALASLKRGNELAKGARLRLTGLGILGWLITALPTLGLYMVLGLGSTLFHPGAVTSLSAGRLFLQQIVGVSVGALTLPYFIALLVLLYYERRVRREGYDVEVAAAALSTEEVPA